jgi:eukaryotic-like serine/threonine-protein kinase
MAVSRPMDRQTFLANVLQSGLVPEGDLDRLLPRLSGADGGTEVARTLVELGALTRFQAERLLAGRTAGFLPGQYRILDQIGRGGMGYVYRAEHRTMGRHVALKLLSPQLLKTDRARDLFLREVRALAQLVHPNIVTAFDAGETAGRFYIVLELVDGPNLDQLVRAEGPLAVERACEYVRQIALGLSCAHGIGIVHRDVKPANLLLRRGADFAGTVKISDFGLARLRAPDAADAGQQGTILAKENTVMGTPDYLSPEQGRCLHQADVRSDLYSLGCTFYFLLTGRVPFPGGTTVDKLIRHNIDPAPDVRETRPDVPAPVAEVVARLLAKAPTDRFQTAAELAEILTPLAAAGPTRAAPPVAPSAACTDTLPTSALAMTESRPEIDLTSEESAKPRTPPLATPREFVGKVLECLRGAFRK